MIPPPPPTPPFQDTDIGMVYHKKTIVVASAKADAKHLNYELI